MRAASAWALVAIIAVCASVSWVDARWPVSLTEIPVFILSLAWVFHLLVRRRIPKGSVVLIPLAAAVAWMGIQILIRATVDLWRTELALLYWLCALAVVFTCLQVFSDLAWRIRFTRALMWLSLAVCVISLSQYFTGNQKIFGLFETNYDPAFVFGPFVYHSHFAAFAELTLPLALYGAFLGGDVGLLDSLAAATLYACVVVSASRAGFILATIELLAAPLLMLRRALISSRRAAVGGIPILAMAVILVLAAGPGRLFARFAVRDNIRPELANSSLAMFKDHLLLGVGLGNWATVYPAYSRFDDGLYANQAHNDWVQWAAEGGVPFLAMMIWIAIWAIPRGLRSVWGIGVPIVFLHCLIDYPVQNAAVAIVFFALLSALAFEGREPGRQQV